MIEKVTALKSEYTIVLSILASLIIISTLTYFNSLLYLPIVVLSVVAFFLLIRSNRFLIAMTVIVFIIDAGNGLTNLPIRIGLFSIILAKLFYSLFFKGFRDKHAVIFIIISIIIPLYGITVSVFRNNNLTYSISDANGYIFLLTGLAFYSFIYYKNELKNYILKCILVVTTFTSLLTIFLFIFWVLGWIHLFGSDSISFYFNKYSLGLAGIEVNGMPRIWLKSDVYLFLSSLMLFGSLLYKKHFFSFKIDFFLLLVQLCTIILSDTRGIWIGFLIGVIVMLFKSKSARMKYLILYLFMFSIPLCILIFSKELQPVFSRILSSFNFSTNASNEVRATELQYLLNEFYRYPIFGQGFGAVLDSGYIRNPNIPYTFELSYFALLYKLGAFVFSLFLFGLALVFNLIRKVEDRMLNAVYSAAFISLMAISVTNPYIVSSLGMFYISILYCLSRHDEAHRSVKVKSQEGRSI